MLHSHTEQDKGLRFQIRPNPFNSEGYSFCKEWKDTIKDPKVIDFITLLNIEFDKAALNENKEDRLYGTLYIVGSYVSMLARRIESGNCHDIDILIDLCNRDGVSISNLPFVHNFISQNQEALRIEEVIEDFDEESRMIKGVKVLTEDGLIVDFLISPYFSTENTILVNRSVAIIQGESMLLSLPWANDVNGIDLDSTDYAFFKDLTAFNEIELLKVLTLFKEIAVQRFIDVTISLSDQSFQSLQKLISDYFMRLGDHEKAACLNKIQRKLEKIEKELNEEQRLQFSRLVNEYFGIFNEFNE